MPWDWGRGNRSPFPFSPGMALFVSSTFTLLLLLFLLFLLLLLLSLSCLYCPLALNCGLGIPRIGPCPWQTLAHPSKQQRALSMQSTSSMPTLQQSEFLPTQADREGAELTEGQEEAWGPV